MFRKKAFKDLGLKAILLGGLTLLSIYFFYRITFINFSPVLVFFSILLFFAELHTIFHLYGMFYSLWPRAYKNFRTIYKKKDLRVNVFICVCGEPAEIVRETVLAAKKAATYYKETINPKYNPQIIVLNDGKAAKKANWREISALAKELHVKHVARTINGGFKAGNINNGLMKTPTSDPENTFDIILDADFAVKPQALIEIIKPFSDKTIDFVQTPQRYKNEKTWVAKASAAHQVFFFEHICKSKGHDNALFLCGTNFAIRRSALDSIGGMDTNFITEDYATSLELHLIGKKGVFMPEVLAEGIAPATLKAYFSQQQRWAKGSFDVSISYLTKILFGPLTLRQKFHYLLSASYYLIGVRDLILMLAPLPYLFWGVSLITANTWQYLAFVYGPLFVYNFILYTVLFRHPIKSLVLDIASFPVFVAAFFSSVLKKELTFIVTIKKYEKENPFAVYKLQIFVTLLLLLGISVGLQRPLTNPGIFLNYFWAIFDVTILSLGFYLIVRENYNTNVIEKGILFFPQASLAIIKSISRVLIPRKSFYGIIFILTVLTIAYYTPAINALANRNSTQEITPSTQNQELLVPSHGAYYGYYNSALNNRPEDPQVELVEGEKASLTMFYQDWTNNKKFDKAFLNELSLRNYIPVITWEPWDAKKKNVAEAQEESITPEAIIDGKYDAFIHEWAHDAAAYKKPFFLRFAHEMNGNWYPWGDTDPTVYRAMWQHVHTIFVEEGATNVIWVWSPNNTDELGNYDSILSYYPGNEYVDWIGISAFNWGASDNTRWTNFTEMIANTYKELDKINKPIMITETSSVSTGGDKKMWFHDMLQSLEIFPKIKAIILFNEDIEGADFGLNSGQSFQSIVQENIIKNSYFIKNPQFKK